MKVYLGNAVNENRISLHMEIGFGFCRDCRRMMAKILTLQPKLISQTITLGFAKFGIKVL